METFKRHATGWIIAAIAIATIAAYANALPGKLFWDDNDGIVNNAYIKDWKFFPNFFSENLIAGAGFMSNYWRPVLLATYAVEWHLWGNWPPGYHIVNILIHLANAILVFLILSRLFKLPFPAAVAALLFAVHPANTEAVTYVSGRGDPLSLLFLLLGTFLYLRIRTMPFSEKAFWLRYAGIALAFLLALMTKERSVTFPLLLGLIDLFVWKTREEEAVPFFHFLRDAVLRIAPFALIAGCYLFLRGTFLNFQNTFNIYAVENYYTEHITARIATFFSIVPDYFSLLVTPIRLYMERSDMIEVITSFSDPSALLGFTLLACVAALGVLMWKRHPAYSFGVLWFFAGLLPISGVLVPVAGLMYEHYLYVPMIGIAFMVGLAAYSLSRTAERRVFKNIIIGIFIVALGLLGFRTALRNREWREPVAFYTQTLAHSPNSMRVWNNLGLSYAELRDFENAERAYRSAASIDPDISIPHHNLGNLYVEQGRNEDAIAEYRASIAREPREPRSYESLYRLYINLNQPEKAEAVKQEFFTNNGIRPQ